jgi:dienelactone hydrolase
MEIDILKDQLFTGANGRSSLLDVYYPKKAAKLPLIIFAHGFKGFKDWGTFPLIFKYMAERGFVVLSFNFSHNGGTVEQAIDFPDLDSFAQNTYSKELMDLDAIYDWVMEHEGKLFPSIQTSEINLLGHSRGGSMAMLHAARNSNISKVASWSAVADLISRLPQISELEEWKNKGRRMIQNSRTKQDMPQLYSFVEDLYRNQEVLNIQEQVSKLRIPQLVVHGTADESVPHKDAQKLIKWNSSAELALIKGAGHTYGGKHPYTEKELPIYTLEAVEATTRFFKT